MNRPLQDWLEFAGLSAVAVIVRNLAFEQLRPIADTIGSIAYWLDRRGRATALANLEAAFPEKFSRSRKHWIARGSYRTFARTMLELFWAPNITEEFVDQQIVFSGLEHDPCHGDTPCATIYCCIHYGNFEWLSLVIAYSITRMPVIAQKFRNPHLGPLFDSLRSSTGNQIIPQERAMLKMLKHLKAGGKFGLLIDLNIDPREGGVPLNTFDGLIASVTPAHVALAQRTGASIVPVECLPLPDGRYNIVHHPPIECPSDATLTTLAQKCWDSLEPGIKAHPECWLWPYKHWRYKPRSGADRYPPYANHNNRFDSLIAPD